SAVGRAGVPVNPDVEPDHVIRGRAEVRAPYADLLPQPPGAYPPPDAYPPTNGSQPTNRQINGVRLPSHDDRSAYDQPYSHHPHYDRARDEPLYPPPAAPPPPTH